MSGEAEKPVETSICRAQPGFQPDRTLEVPRKEWGEPGQSRALEGISTRFGLGEGRLLEKKRHWRRVQVEARSWGIRPMPLRWSHRMPGGRRSRCSPASARSGCISAWGVRPRSSGACWVPAMKDMEGSVLEITTASRYGRLQPVQIEGSRDQGMLPNVELASKARGPHPPALPAFPAGRRASEETLHPLALNS